MASHFGNVQGTTTMTMELLQSPLGTHPIASSKHRRRRVSSSSSSSSRCHSRIASAALVICLCSAAILPAEGLATTKTQTYGESTSSFSRHNNHNENDKTNKYADSFHVRLNEFFKAPVPAPLKGAISVFREHEDNDDDHLDTNDMITLLTAAPGSPAVPKPLWFVLMASLPTGLLWYGYYKFVVEEELLHMELDSDAGPRGFGGYGTLGPSTYGILLGPLASVLDLPGGMHWSLLGVTFLYYTQFLLYDRVNRLYTEGNGTTNTASSPAPLQAWWCLPIFFPFNLIVGLRQVHFLSQYCYQQRGIQTSALVHDPVADFFPFIKKSSLTWQELVVTPSLWCSHFSNVESLDLDKLPEPLRRILSNTNSNTNTR